MSNRRRWAAGLMAVLLMAATSGCATAGAASPEPTVSPSDRLYVSIGDSYAAGYQPSAGATTTNGFAYQVADRAGLRLVNFGCSGVTSTELLNTVGCDAAALGPGAPGYPSSSQSSAAVAFLKRYHAQVALVTVVVGGNDVKPCLLTDNGGVRPDATACANAAVGKLRANLATLLGDLRSAVGPGVHVVGLTYPDVYLGQWVSSANGRVVAADSVGFFRNVLNPALQDRYKAIGATFVDVTAATGGYGPLTDTVQDGTYGTLPVPVARVCTLTFYCSRGGDPHPTTDGYTTIANQVLTAAGLS